jgi:hypothetical protein
MSVSKKKKKKKRFDVYNMFVFEKKGRNTPCLLKWRKIEIPKKKKSLINSLLDACKREKKNYKQSLKSKMAYTSKYLQEKQTLWKCWGTKHPLKEKVQRTK